MLPLGSQKNLTKATIPGSEAALECASGLCHPRATQGHQEPSLPPPLPAAAKPFAMQESFQPLLKAGDGTCWTKSSIWNGKPCMLRAGDEQIKPCVR